MSVRAADAGYLLQSLARGGVVELAPEHESVLARLREAGLVRSAADPGPERERLGALRAELASAASEKGAPARARERALRTSILEISERLAETEGAAEVRTVSGGGPYRGAVGSSGARLLVTQKGRALLSDLAPRLLRVGHATLDSFAADMQALRTAIAWRADRAAQIERLITRAHGVGLGQSARSVAIGLSAVRDEPAGIARTFSSALRVLASEGRFSLAQDASAAECACIAGLTAANGGLEALRALRARLLDQYTSQRTEDALDAALLLATVPEAARQARIELAVGLARAIAARGVGISMPFALVATAGDESLAPHVAPAIESAWRTLEHEIRSDSERMAVSVLLTFARGDVAAHVDRWRALRTYLARFSPDGMAIAAALLSWIELEPAETLDDLRLAAAELQKQRLADGGAETMSLAIKLLVSVAMLAAGSEGDHEERLALAPVVVPRAPHLGLHGALTALPLVTTALAAFHRPVLDAALEYERVYQSTHSSYVFGGPGWG